MDLSTAIPTVSQAHSLCQDSHRLRVIRASEMRKRFQANHKTPEARVFLAFAERHDLLETLFDETWEQFMQARNRAARPTQLGGTRWTVTHPGDLASMPCMVTLDDGVANCDCVTFHRRFLCRHIFAAIFAAAGAVFITFPLHEEMTAWVSA
jgi:hypothetical protein